MTIERNEETALPLKSPETKPAAQVPAKVAQAAIPEYFHKPSEVRPAIVRFKDQFNAVIPKTSGIQFETVLQGLMVCIAGNPALLDCDAQSLISGALTAARVGLPLEPELKQAYIVPRRAKGSPKKKATLIISYRGQINLMQRAGAIDYVETNIVYSEDEWSIQPGFPPTPIHKPNLSVMDRGEMIAVYAIAYKAGHIVGKAWMDKAAVMKRRDRSESKNSDFSPWVQWPEEMWKKTCIRELAKTMPMSLEVVRAIEVDDDRPQPLTLETATIGGDDVIDAAFESAKGEGQPE